MDIVTCFALFCLSMYVVFPVVDVDVSCPGGTHIFGRTGMWRPNGLLFYKKSLNMGPVFYPKNLLTWVNFKFWLSPKLHDLHAKTPKIAEFLKNRPIFEGKSLKMGTIFGQNHP